MMEELREEARKILTDGKWLSVVEAGDREVQVNWNGFYCHSWDRFDPEFVTTDIEEAISFLYPE